MSVSSIFSSLPQRASIGERFFTGMSYSSMLKKMKKRLGESADYYTKQASDNRDQEEGLYDIKAFRKLFDKDRY